MTPVADVPNPDFLPPAEYLKAGFYAEPGVIRPELLAERAIAFARACLIAGVAPASLARLNQELAVMTRLGDAWPQRRVRFTEWASKGARSQPPLLAQLLGAAATAVKKPEDLAAFAAHARRIQVLMAFEATLGGANAIAEPEGPPV